MIKTKQNYFYLVAVFSADKFLYFENRILESEITKRILDLSNYFQDCSKAEVFFLKVTSPLFSPMVDH